MSGRIAVVVVVGVWLVVKYWPAEVSQPTPAAQNQGDAKTHLLKRLASQRQVPAKVADKGMPAADDKEKLLRAELATERARNTALAQENVKLRKQAVSEAISALTKRTAAAEKTQPAKVTFVAVPGSTPRVYETGHLVDAVKQDGRFVFLEDGTTWEIELADQLDTALWLEAEEVVILETGDPVYPYTLLNKSNDETAAARPVD